MAANSFFMSHNQAILQPSLCIVQAATHPVFNVRWERVRHAQEHFSALPRDHAELLREAEAQLDRRFADPEA